MLIPDLLFAGFTVLIVSLSLDPGIKQSVDLRAFEGLGRAWNVTGFSCIVRDWR
jgi:hypothetical protein